MVPASSSSSPPPLPSLLLVDDDFLLARSVARLLKCEWECTITTEARLALELLRQGRSFDAILCDLTMPDVDGIAFFEALERELPSVLGALIFFSGGATTARQIDFLRRIPNPILDKPVSREGLRRALARRRPGGPGPGLASSTRSTRSMTPTQQQLARASSSFPPPARRR
jgi:CheY-like chemotaxis protein